MKITCISASNVLHKKDASASTRVCETACERIHSQRKDILTEIIRLSEYTFTNCIFCGRCKEERSCIYDPAMNFLYRKLCESDRLLLVVPFYSVIPSKATMVMEKLNQFYYTAWLRDAQAQFPLAGKKIALIGHGGSNLEDHPQTAAAYRNLLLQPLHYSFQSLGLDVVIPDGVDAPGVIFGLEGYEKKPSSILPDMVHDWEKIKQAISPLIEELLK